MRRFVVRALSKALPTFSIAWWITQRAARSLSPTPPVIFAVAYAGENHSRIIELIPQLLPPRSLAGRNKIACSSAKTPPTARPSNRNGNEISQTTGKRTSASKASGQQSTKRMHHRSSAMSAFIDIEICSVGFRACPLQIRAAVGIRRISFTITMVTGRRFPLPSRCASAPARRV